ncbi:MAG TPA: anthranilate synthase component I [Streptosporangiaceae bacterium]|nr:anthranilate synthase component I [Streptosporangiaceae bacterium]
MDQTSYLTQAGVRVHRAAEPFDPVRLDDITRQVQDRPGGVLSSGMEYPGRYSRWHMAYVDPPVQIVARGRQVAATALNQRGLVLLPAISAALQRAGKLLAGSAQSGQVEVVIAEGEGVFAEEDRSRRPTVFSAIRELMEAFAGPDQHLGLYGAFGYDLAFQFEPVRLRAPRDPASRDLVLHLPDLIYVVDRKRETATVLRYDFETAAGSTAGIPREPAQVPDGSLPAQPVSLPDDPLPGSYARVVAEARDRFARGDLFEVVPSHTFHAPCPAPALFFERLRERNPAPYEFFFNLGGGEYLVGASPEMYVRVTGDRVETCPIAGTIARGADPLGDAEAIRTLLTSPKEESELTMCTDVDRNDKSRICVPGSIKVIGRRQIELYSRLIHTVDHVEGRLRPGFDALDAFLTHMWAVTVTGAPKNWAMQFIEDHESQPRRWYGGAVGMIGFDGNMNTGLTLRTAHITGGVAAVRVGATLLFDSDPQDEERETVLKARALLETLAEAAAAAGAGSAGKRGAAGPATSPAAGAGGAGEGMAVLLVDHQDSFVHTLAGYFREQGAVVTTLRAGFDAALLDEYAPDLVVLSPGPGRPADFECDKLLTALDERGLPAFGVCLGLQAMVEHAGGSLGLLATPVHGKPGQVLVLGGSLLAGLPAEFTAGRYHSLHARPEQVTGGFEVTAVTADGVVMAIEDRARGRWGVQFHPESILSTAGGAGHQIIGNVLRLCRERG